MLELLTLSKEVTITGVTAAENNDASLFSAEVKLMIIPSSSLISCGSDNCHSATV